MSYLDETKTMEDDLLYILNSNTICSEDGEDVWSTFEPKNKDGRDFTSIGRWTLKDLMAEAWMKGYNHGHAS